MKGELIVDLTVQIFIQLRRTFFDARGRAIPFSLRDKRNTQDDPLDEFLAKNVLSAMPGVTCIKAPGPLVSPDLVLYRKSVRGKSASTYCEAPDQIVAIEVKKLERDKRGNVARPSGLDYNTTPPCGTVCVYDKNERQVWLRGFYLFVCLERTGKNSKITALVLADGNVLNSDAALYRSISVDTRSKEINLGSYGDGANRVRPMLIFGNPLGAPYMDRAITLIHFDDALAAAGLGLRKVATLWRTQKDGKSARFVCFRYGDDFPIPGEPVDLRDPFPTPKRDTATRGRGKFNLPFATK